MTRRWISAITVAAVLAPSVAVAEQVVWVETERFADLGGWAADSQFIDQMGSPYLLAAGLGTPVADATTKVDLPSPGKYRLWARTRDWIPDHHPGRFQILLDGRAVAPTFGQSGAAGWQWEDGGVHDLGEAVELRLHDLTGYYGRCDAVVLSDELNWTPPADTSAIGSLRERHGGTSPNVHNMGDSEVVVIGGGLAGCVAAVAAARLGAETVLIHNRPVLGGNASIEVLVPPVGVWPYGKQDPLDPRESGIVEEFQGKGVQTLEEAKLYSGRLMRMVAAEPKLRLQLNAHATGVEMKSPGEIASVLAVDTSSGRRMRFGGKVFIDCTGDGVVGVAAGAEYRHGREPRSMYGESMAPDAGDKQTMGNSLKYATVPEQSPQPFAPPAWAMRPRRSLGRRSTRSLSGRTKRGWSTRCMRWARRSGSISAATSAGFWSQSGDWVATSSIWISWSPSPRPARRWARIKCCWATSTPSPRSATAPRVWSPPRWPSAIVRRGRVILSAPAARCLATRQTPISLPCESSLARSARPCEGFAALPAGEARCFGTGPGCCGRQEPAGRAPCRSGRPAAWREESPHRSPGCDAA